MEPTPGINSRLSIHHLTALNPISTGPVYGKRYFPFPLWEGQTDRGLAGMWQVAGIKNGKSKEILQLGVHGRGLACLLAANKCMHASRCLSSMHPAPTHTISPGVGLGASPSCAGPTS